MKVVAWMGEGVGAVDSGAQLMAPIEGTQARPVCWSTESWHIEDLVLPAVWSWTGVLTSLGLDKMETTILCYLYI